MKKYFRGPVVIVTIIVLIIAIFALLGFRITYNPSLNIDWNAVSACAGCASVIVSALAIWYAVQVPKKIAEEENKISLFDKRYEFFITFTKALAFVKVINQTDVNTREKLLSKFIKVVGGISVYDKSYDVIKDESTLIQYKVVATLGQAKYIFDLQSDKLIETFSRDLIDLLQATDGELNNCYKKLAISSVAVYEQLNSKFEEQLLIKR